MTLNEVLKKTKLRNIERMQELKKKGDYKSPIEWEEYHMLKHKYSPRGRRIKEDKK